MFFGNTTPEAEGVKVEENNPRNPELSIVLQGRTKRQNIM